MTDIGWIDETENPAMPRLDRGLSAVYSVRNSALGELSASSLDTAGRLALEAVNIPAILDKPWLITSEPAIEKPTVEEELSKIHEELATIRQDNNELRKERKADKKENKELKEENGQVKKENKKLKSKLKKEKTKSKSNNKQMQSEVDDLQSRMNEVEWRVDIKEKGK